jgi:hypothetical protein
MTKAMTATLAAILVEDGLISWETTPVDVWPELTNAIHPAFRNVTLRQFLSHSSGMKRDDVFAPAEDSAPGTLMQKRRAWSEHLLTRAPEGTAGTFSYSNVGYVVAGAMIENARGITVGNRSDHPRVRTTRHDSHRFRSRRYAGRDRRTAGHISRNGGFDPVSPAAPKRTFRVPWDPPATCTRRSRIMRGSCRRTSRARARRVRPADGGFVPDVCSGLWSLTTRSDGVSTAIFRHSVYRA